MTDILVPAAKIREAHTPPVACSSCGGQYPDRRHVDFGSAGDYGMVASQNVAGGKMVSVDDLIVCDECLTAAAAVLGLADVTEAETRVERLNERLTDTGQRLGKALEAIEKLKAAVSAVEQVKRPPGRPRKEQHGAS
jgi:hypothetical protein